MREKRSWHCSLLLHSGLARPLPVSPPGSRAQYGSPRAGDLSDHGVCCPDGLGLGYMEVAVLEKTIRPGVKETLQPNKSWVWEWRGQKAGGEGLMEPLVRGGDLPSP